MDENDAMPSDEDAYTAVLVEIQELSDSYTYALERARTIRDTLDDETGRRIEAIFGVAWHRDSLRSTS